MYYMGVSVVQSHVLWEYDGATSGCTCSCPLTRFIQVPPTTVLKHTIIINSKFKNEVIISISSSLTSL